MKETEWVECQRRKELQMKLGAGLNQSAGSGRAKWVEIWKGANGSKNENV